MRIALVCPYSWDRFGGVQSHVRGLAKSLIGRGHEVLILAPTSSGSLPAAGRSPDAERVTNVGRALRIPANGSVATICFGPLVAARVRDRLEEFKPDVVHLHEPLIPSVSLLALWSTRSPTVGTFHAAAESSLGYRAASPVLGRAARSLTVRTAVSDAARELACRYFPGEYMLTPNGVEIERFSRAEPLDLGPGKKVVFLSRIERRKGLEVLIQAMTRLRDTDAVLVVAGGGPKEKQCRRLARQLGVPARFVGVLPDQDVPRLYASADVYCAPGLGRESFGIVLVEAMAAGAPVVCSDLPGFRAVVGGAANLVPAGQPGALADALRKVLAGDDDAARMRTMSSRLAGSFDWRRLVTGVESAYQRALDR
jgi:phosphatidylinositol alpha-mannosyltransferase